MGVERFRSAVALATAIFTTVVFTLANFGQAQAADPIKIGVVVPITSVLAPYGKPFVEALQMAVDEANAKGGIDGRMIELVVEDSQASNTVAINALNKVLEQKPIAVFGSSARDPGSRHDADHRARENAAARRPEHAPRHAPGRQILLSHRHA